MEHSCLNCGAALDSRFCPDCGQKADTHRITLGHFITHDLLHGVWHIERGILFTLKEALLRPGQAALDYISGKRVRYYNVFYLCLLIIGLDVVVSRFFLPVVTYTQKSQTEVMGFVMHNIKFVVLGVVPMIAVDGWLLFRKLKLNVAEHFILAGISLLGMLCFSLLFIALKSFGGFAHGPRQIVQLISIFCGIAFPAWTYLNAAWKRYRAAGFAWRIGLFYLLLLLEITALMVTIVVCVTDDGNVTIN
jgi:hypothetical protein